MPRGGHRPRLGGADQETTPLQPLDRGIQRALRDRPHVPRQSRDALTQLIAVQRGFVQESEDGELQHAAILPHSHALAVPPILDTPVPVYHGLFILRLRNTSSPMYSRSCADGTRRSQ
ncbi:hypothetical protein SGLAM104S_07688 [Streptomyces glaucescens]